jgi:hypothetical protein
MEGTAGSIPKFGEWKANDGGSPYTMYFENARKRRSNSGIAPPPGASPARIISAPAGPRTPPRAPDAKPVKPEDRANRSRNQAKVSNTQVPFNIVFTPFQEQPRQSKFNYSSPFFRTSVQRPVSSWAIDCSKTLILAGSSSCQKIRISSDKTLVLVHYMSRKW